MLLYSFIFVLLLNADQDYGINHVGLRVAFVRPVYGGDCVAWPYLTEKDLATPLHLVEGWIRRDFICNFCCRGNIWYREMKMGILSIRQNGDISDDLATHLIGFFFFSLWNLTGFFGATCIMKSNLVLWSFG